MRSIHRLPCPTGLRPQAALNGGRGSTSLLLAGVRLRRDLGGWDATRDFWWIAGRECSLKLTVQLVVNFSLFALLARHIFLWHCATSVLSSVTAPRRYDLMSRREIGIRWPAAERRRLSGHKQRTLWLQARSSRLRRAVFPRFVQRENDWRDYRCRYLGRPEPIWRRGECCGEDGRKRAQQNVIRAQTRRASSRSWSVLYCRVGSPLRLVS